APLRSDPGDRSAGRAELVVLLPEDRHVGAVPRVYLLVGINPVHGLIDRRGSLTKAGRDQLQLTGISSDVSRRINAGASSLHQTVHDDLALLAIETPLSQRADIAVEPQHRKNRVRIDIARGLRLHV